MILVRHGAARKGADDTDAGSWSLDLGDAKSEIRAYAASVPSWSAQAICVGENTRALSPSWATTRV